MEQTNTFIEACLLLLCKVQLAIAVDFTKCSFTLVIARCLLTAFVLLLCFCLEHGQIQLRRAFSMP